MGTWPVSEHPEGVVVDVWVVPGAARTEVAGVHDGAVRLRVAAPPAGGEANRAAARLLEEVLRGRRVELVHGHTSRRKRFLVRGIDVVDAGRRLGLGG